MQKLIITIFLILLALNSKASTKEQHTKVLLRIIAHEFLLQINDSTTRILPINYIDGRYAIQFEKEFSFDPEQVLFSTIKTLEKTAIEEDFIIEIEDCTNGAVVHSSQTTPNKTLGPCKLRVLPKDCYTFFFTIVTPQQQPKEGNKNYIYLILLIPIVLFGAYLITTKRNKKEELTPIGDYLFDSNKITLLYNNQPIEISSKEADLLQYFYNNINQTLEREQILNVIWNDNGNYIGRTLDVYVSKLRKKLQQDPRIKIINIRGVGYKFIIDKTT